MNRELPGDGVRPGPERRRSHRSRRPARVGVSAGDVAWTLLCVVIAGAIALFALTDVWPFMHEVIWQQSWRPLCDNGHGHLEFCRP